MVAVAGKIKRELSELEKSVTKALNGANGSHGDVGLCGPRCRRAGERQRTEKCSNTGDTAS